MRIRFLVWQIVANVIIGGLLGALAPTQAEDSNWQDLFNGKDLNGWETWLRAPEDQGGKEGEPIGLNKDPLGVFTVKDGELRISGEVFGCISSLQQFQDYQIRFDFKWGEKKWPPREHQLRDSGFLYHCHGPHGAFWNAWKACMEYQVQEGDVGDIYPLKVPHPKSLIPKELESDPKAIYDPEQQPATTSWRVSHSGKHERSNGTWNTCQVIVSGDQSVHIVNGFVVNRVLKMKSRLEGKVQPLTAGYLQFQSEAAEVFYRRIQLRDLPELPADEASLLAAMKSDLATVQVNTTPITVTYENTGSSHAQIPAVEVFGLSAGDFQFDLPEMPTVVAPGEKLEIGVHFRPRDNSQIPAKATLRLEGLDGPAENTRIVLQSE